jgi:hypothetical protein
MNQGLDDEKVGKIIVLENKFSMSVNIKTKELALAD